MCVYSPALASGQAKEESVDGVSSSGTSEKIEKALANVRALIDETPEPWRSRWCSYVEQHPTHFDWRDDVKALVDKAESEFDDIYINTYYDHPPGWGLDAVSIDVWDSDGRGCALDWDLHDVVFARLFNDPDPPNFRWTLTKGSIWTPAIRLAEVERLR